MFFLDFQVYLFLPFLIFLILAFHFCLIFAETWRHVFRREGVVWEGTLPEYTLWQTAHIQLTPGRLSIADLLESLVRVRVSVGGELEIVGEELEESYSGWRSVNGDGMESELRRNISDSRRRLQELAWSCFGSHTGYDLSGADNPPPHTSAIEKMYGGKW